MSKLSLDCCGDGRQLFQLRCPVDVWSCHSSLFAHTSEIDCSGGRHYFHSLADKVQFNRFVSIFSGEVGMASSLGGDLHNVTTMETDRGKLCRYRVSKSSSSSNKQGQKLVSSDALAVQSQGLRVSRSKGFKSQVVLGSPKMFWEKK